jgi:beta-N-acetylglucosaminidase
VVFKEVLELSRSEYREVEVARLDPDWLAGNLATHHYATDERWAVTDAMRRRRRG